MTKDNQRAAFEAHMRENSAWMSLEHVSAGGYRFNTTQRMWTAWQAAIEHYRKQRGEPVFTLTVLGPLQEWKPTLAAMSIPEGVHNLYLTPQPAEPVQNEPQNIPEIIPTKPTDSSSIDWDDAQRIADLTEVDELLRDFADDPTGDAGTMIVRAVIHAVRRSTDPTIKESFIAAIPGPLEYSPQHNDAYITGWNDCRAAMITADRAGAQTGIKSPESRADTAPAGGAQSADKADAERYRWIRQHWGRIDDTYVGDSGQIIEVRVNSNEGWDIGPDSLDAAIDAARAKQE